MIGRDNSTVRPIRTLSFRLMFTAPFAAVPSSAFVTSNGSSKSDPTSWIRNTAWASPDAVA